MSRLSSDRTKLLHDQAMALAHRARLLDPHRARIVYAEAFRAEEEALFAWTTDTDGAEPTRSILTRSAAAIALHAGLLDACDVFCRMVDEETAAPWIHAEIQDIRTALSIAVELESRLAANRSVAARYLESLSEGVMDPAAHADLWRDSRSLDDLHDLHAELVAAVVSETFFSADGSLASAVFDIDRLVATQLSFPQSHDDVAARYEFAATVSEGAAG